MSKRSHLEKKTGRAEPIAEDNPPVAAMENAGGGVRNDSSEDDNPHTPKKKARLNMPGGGRSPTEETKAFGFVSAATGPHAVTPGKALAVGEMTGVSAEGSGEEVVSGTGNLGAGSAVRSAVRSASDPWADSAVRSAFDPGTDSAVRRALFDTPRKHMKPEPAIVTPSLALAEAQSPARKKLFFGRLCDELVVKESVKKVYGLIKRLTGSIGGNASHGPIYGELTMVSMQKMVNLMKEHAQFDSSSMFIDVGSGIGKPNFHVAHDPGVRASFGIEVDADRWLLSMSCLRSILDFAADNMTAKKNDTTVTDEVHSLGEQLAKQKCIFIQGDIREAKVFDPFTHVYMFSIGFPPALWVELAGIWNRSKAGYLICFHGPKDIVQNYEFDVELLAQTQTSMHGSKEGHMGYLYKRKTLARRSATKTSPVDPLFSEGIEIMEGGFDRIREWTENATAQKMHSSPSANTRASRASSCSPNIRGKGQSPPSPNTRGKRALWK